MATTNFEVITHPQKNENRPFTTYSDLSALLKANGLSFSGSGYYWQVGTIVNTQGWILHLSTIQIKLIELIELLLPELIVRNVSFKIPRTFFTAVNLLEGNLGYIHLGKLVCIYPDSTDRAKELAILLIKLTGRFNGPDIPTDFHLGGAVYTRYGSFDPIIIKDADGTPAKYIQDDRGKLIPDPYHIPFRLPIGVTWPFEEIINYHSAKRPLLLNKKYYSINTLKHDPKGAVMKAFYFNKPWEVRSCIIKQAAHFMQADEAGRDITDKLKWQLQLFATLHEHVPMPRIFDHFEEQGAFHVVMDFIDGISLTQWIGLLYNGRSWFDLSVQIKIKILDCLLEVTHIIRHFHSLGYIHRDITPENFIIDKKGKLFLIDLELTWSLFSSYPDPPFAWGTPGFMSPEQILGLRPTFKEDIYALGCSILSFLTNIPGIKWPLIDLRRLHKILPIFIERDEIINLICACLEDTPEKRPEMDELISVLTNYRYSIESGSTVQVMQTNQHLSLEPIIQSALRGLTNPELLSPKGLWVSRIQRADSKMVNEQLELIVKPGWHTGVAGPMWVIARAKKADFDVSSSLPTFESNWNFLRKQYFDGRTAPNPGFFYGAEGIAQAVVEGIESNLITWDDHVQNILKTCFIDPLIQFDLKKGISGQGIALLRCLDWLDPDQSQNLLKKYIQKILAAQKKDGSWSINPKNSNSDPYAESTEIIWFLLAYFDKYPNNSAHNALNKSLDWLISTVFTKQGDFKKKSTLSFSSKINILLCLIHAYRIYEDESIRRLTENNLMDMPARLTSSNFTLHNGLSAYGHALLDAMQIFDNCEWRDRAKWIVQLFELTFLESNQTLGYWITEHSLRVTTDLFQGTSGILDFLIRFNSPNLFSHPLWPNPPFIA